VCSCNVYYPLARFSVTGISTRIWAWCESKRYSKITWAHVEAV